DPEPVHLLDLRRRVDELRHDRVPVSLRVHEPVTVGADAEDASAPRLLDREGRDEVRVDVEDHAATPASTRSSIVSARSSSGETSMPLRANHSRTSAGPSTTRPRWSDTI